MKAVDIRRENRVLDGNEGEVELSHLLARPSNFFDQTRLWDSQVFVSIIKLCGKMLPVLAWPMYFPRFQTAYPLQSVPSSTSHETGVVLRVEPFSWGFKCFPVDPLRQGSISGNISRTNTAWLTIGILQQRCSLVA
ncbi:unnamed protein product [Diplocarpon coronariae]